MIFGIDISGGGGCFGIIFILNQTKEPERKRKMSWTSAGVDFNDASSQFRFILCVSREESKMLDDVISYLEKNGYDYTPDKDFGNVSFFYGKEDCPFILIDEKTFEWIFVE